MHLNVLTIFYPTPLHPIPPHTLQKLKIASLRVRFSVLKCLNMLIVGCFFDVIPLPYIAMFSCCILCKARGIISNMLRSYGAQDHSDVWNMPTQSRWDMNIDTKKDADPEVWQNVLLIDIDRLWIVCSILRISRTTTRTCSGSLGSKPRSSVGWGCLKLNPKTAAKVWFH